VYLKKISYTIVSGKHLCSGVHIKIFSSIFSILMIRREREKERKVVLKYFDHDGKNV
jgi:hypothetical protein